MDKLIEICGLALCLWVGIYLLAGYVMARERFDPAWRTLVYMCFWGVLPFFAKRSQEFAESMEPIPVEGLCSCKKRHPLDHGHKWCSVCGGQIKDRVWKRERKW